MKKIIFGIFAHPDDEAFGPAGTLLLETRGGTELHLITLTVGEAGTNPDHVENLGVVREKEWRAAGKLLGATNMHFLGFHDGQLNNLVMIEAGRKIIDIIAPILKQADNDTTVEFMTIDLNGITGHIDHIVAARAACWAFYRLKTTDSRMSRIRLACLPETTLPSVRTDWLYMEPGRTSQEIDEIIDACDLQSDIIEIVRAHHSQRGDGERHIANSQDDLGLNYFIVKT